MQGRTVISLEDVVFDYPGKRALHGVSLEVREGRISALVGPNGAGKTTLLRCVAALHRPVSGSVRVGGLDAVERPRECHRIVGYLSDFFGVYEQLTARQGLLYTALAHGMPNGDAEKAMRRASTRVGLDESLDEPAATLSRGLRQRLALGQAIVHEPKVLLLDEPASGLDPEARHGLSSLFVDLQRDGVTLLISSHILAELEDYCTDMVVMRSGRIIEQHRLGEPTRVDPEYVVTTASDAAEAVRILEGHPATHGVRLEGKSIRFRASADPESAAAIIESLVLAGVRVIEFGRPEPSMQDVYLATVGSEDDSRES